MEAQEINVKARTRRGKMAARALRREGYVPAIVYGPKMKSAPISLEEREVEKSVSAGSRTQLMKLLSTDADVNDKLVLVKELQRHPLTRRLVHADLYEVDVNERLSVEVALSFVGKAAGVELGGILQPVRRSIEVLCLPMQIPQEIEIDVSALGIHDAIHISDVKAPDGVEIPFDADVTLVTVLPPVVEETKAEETEGEEEEGEKVEGEGEEDGEKTEKKEEPAEG